MGRRKSNRRNRQQVGEQKIIKDKFLEDRLSNLPPLKPLNSLQKDYIDKVNTCPVVFATGYAGTSKTYIPTVIAADRYRLGEINKIYFIRPAVSDSKSLGFFSGDMLQKSKLWLAPILDTLYERLGREVVDIAISRGDFEPIPLELIKGRSLKNSFVIIDEAEDLTEKEFIKCITRVGEGCTCIFAGDIHQKDIKHDSGLSLGKKLAEDNLDFNWGFVDFDRPSDIVRGDVAKNAILALRRLGRL